MPVKLEGAYEPDSFLQLVRDKANKLLKDKGLRDWTVTLRPVTLADHQRVPQHEDDDAAPEDRMLVFIDKDKKEMTIAGFGDGQDWRDEVDGTPDQQAQWVAEVQIVELITDHGVGGDDDWGDGEDDE